MLDNYKDIITEIELSKIRIEGLKKEYWHIRKDITNSSNFVGGVKGVSYDSLPGGSKNDTPLEVHWDRIRRIDNAIMIEQDRIKILENTKTKMDKKLEELEGLDKKIYSMQLQGYTLKEIADKLSYNESYIRRVAAEIKKERN